MMSNSAVIFSVTNKSGRNVSLNVDPTTTTLSKVRAWST
jgi:hypothetical protein